MPINETRPKPDYNCSQAALYAGLDMVWDSQAEQETEFLAENTKYTAGLSVTKKAEIDAARILPDGQARYAESEELRLQLIEDLDEVLDKWNSLDGYIKKTFMGVHYKPRIEEAGKGYYRDAYKRNWEVVKLLLQAGKTFITNYSAELTTDGGMPAAFVADYDAVKAGFETKYASFMDARQTAQEQTDVKVNANNAIYADGREMMEDGKHIFRKNASLRERFIWEKVQALITPPSSGLKTVVREGDVSPGQTGSFDGGLIQATDATMVTIEVSPNPLRLSSNNTEAAPSGPVFWDAPAGTTVKTISEFLALIGASEINHYIKIQNLNAVLGHFKITFSEVE